MTKPSEPSHQLDWLAGGAPKPAKKVSKASNRKVVATPPKPGLPLGERRFLPIAGVPKTRGDCPDTSKGFCEFVRCRHHLFRIDACDRAGRPGLSQVPRDEHGHTLSTPGAAGRDRPGTTLWPAWLELERTCKVVISRDDDGRVCGVDTNAGTTGRPVGTWELFREHTHDGEPLEVLDDDGKLCGAAELTPDGVKFRALIGGYVVTLRRVRGVPSCALDEADKGRRTNEQVGDAIGRHRTLAAREIRGAAVKVRDEGVDLRDLVPDE